MKEISVVITGLGTHVGISILQALRMSKLPCRIIGTDRDPVSAGLFLADAVRILPDISKEPRQYVNQMINLCQQQKVKIVFAGSEAEMKFLARHKGFIERQTGTYLMVNNEEVIDIACDKWKTFEYLRPKGIPVPDTVLGENKDRINELIHTHKFPLVVKPRSSTGSKNLFIVDSKIKLEAALNLVDNAIVQEYLRPPEQEYTVGVFMQKSDKCFGSIVLKRQLGSGLTHKAIVCQDQDIQRISEEAAVALGALGPINIQLRLTKKGPVIFEINPRISSSSIMRAYFGFNEPELSIKQFVLKEELVPCTIKQGIALRYWEVIYPDIKT